MQKVKLIFFMSCENVPHFMCCKITSIFILDGQWKVEQATDILKLINTVFDSLNL